GRVVVIGDAAYRPSPLTGMGTTSGLVGAYVLAGEIAKHLNDSKGVHNPLVSAFETYDSRFRPFMRQVQTLGPGLWIPSSSWAIAVVNFLIGIFAFL
ncbi:hypothetical protein B0J14DRAFT_430513, partial [Halenospora varia]